MLRIRNDVNAAKSETVLKSDQRHPVESQRPNPGVLHDERSADRTRLADVQSDAEAEWIGVKVRERPSTRAAAGTDSHEDHDTGNNPGHQSGDEKPREARRHEASE
jgi:hypothetical protein